MGEQYLLDHVSKEEIRRNPEYYLEVFSEGSSTLRDVLKETDDFSTDNESADKGISSFECCKGHNDRYYNDTYVMFSVAYDRKEYIYSIINAINSCEEVSYALGQERVNNTIALDVRLPYNCGIEAERFLKQIKNGLEQPKILNREMPHLENLLFLIENGNIDGYQLIIKKTTDYSLDECAYDIYTTMFVEDNGEYLVNRRSDENVRYFNLDGISNLKPEELEFSGIQKIKRL